MRFSTEITLCWPLWFFCRFSVPVSSEIRETSKIQEPITSTVHRRIRALSYPEDSEMGIFFALAIPLDDPVSTKAISVAFFFEANYHLANTEETKNYENEDEEDEAKEEEMKTRRWQRSMNTERRSITRRTIYTILESKFESLGFPGRACLLRSICETRRNPLLHRHNGLLGDLLRILFTPATSLDEGLSHEYTKVENQSETPEQCSTTYFRCPFNIYDFITAH